MSVRRRSPLTVCLLLALVSVQGLALAEESVRFHFQPVDGEVWIREMTDVKNADYGGQSPNRSQETRTEIELRYEKLPEGGWRVLQTPRSATLLMDGQPFPNPALEATLGHELRVQLDEEGRAVAVEGFPEFMRKLERVLDPESYARMRQSTSVEAMEAREKLEWDRILEGLRGRDIALGEVWRYEDELFSGQGFVDVAGFVRFDGWTELEGVRGVKISCEFDNQGKAVAQAENAAHTFSRRDGEEANPATNLVCGGSRVRVIVPDTGMLLYEVEEKWFELPLPSGQGAKARLEEKHTYRYRRATGP